MTRRERPFCHALTGPTDGRCKHHDSPWHSRDAVCLDETARRLVEHYGARVAADALRAWTELEDTP